MKIVLMKHVEYNYETVVIANDDGKLGIYEGDDYVRLSRTLIVDFEMLPDADIVGAKVAVIDKQMVKVRADAEASITALEGRKQELLAIGHES